MDTARSLPVERLWCWDNFRLEERDCIRVPAFEAKNELRTRHVTVYVPIDREEWNGSTPAMTTYTLNYSCWLTKEDALDRLKSRWLAEIATLERQVRFAMEDAL